MLVNIKKFITGLVLSYYCNDPMFSDKKAWANLVVPDQTAPQGLHCLPFLLHLLDALLYYRATVFKF